VKVKSIPSDAKAGNSKDEYEDAFYPSEELYIDTLHSD